jgi:hypothetical protein
MFAPEVGYDVPPTRDHDAPIKIWVRAHLPKGHVAAVGSAYDAYAVLVMADGDGPLYLLRLAEPLTHQGAAAAAALLRTDDSATGAALAARFRQWAEAFTAMTVPPAGATLAPVKGSYLLPIDGVRP